MKIDCPCKHCTVETGRTPTCKFDGTCDKYSTWNEKHIEENRKRRSAQERENMYRGYCVETTQRNRRCREHGTSKGKVL